MITRLLAKFRKPVSPPQACIPDGQRVYCIGDIHGRADLLQQLHEKILADATDYSGKKTIVYLGDYIDRGEQTRQVIELLLSEPLPGFDPVYLMGNHEQAMLNFIEYPEASAAWLTFGGKQTLDSYGIPLLHTPSEKELVQLAKQLLNKLPELHWLFLHSCKSSWQCGNYYFVHAGIEPGVALDKQTLESQLWIRDEFLQNKTDHGAIVVHGHSITDEPELLPNRIGIDTGAFKSGVLTCLVLENSEQRFLKTASVD